ncbi:centromere protein K isoform X2 [Aquila chrysaetos chrysaetos]|uniref:Centromere protein K n=1 Tax=Aquila chrysaetos chrysaetos TaxID=223781 RepID=A0A663F3D8_AQUCH|nr:centromere protein K isoform X2 [Aquila chrysaetos chrysaetos]
MAEYLPEITNDSVCPVDAKEELLNECESIWQKMEECQSKLKVQGGKTLPKLDTTLSLLITRVKALQAEYNQWQKRTPEIISNNPDVLLALGKEELQKTKNDLEMVLATVQSKNEQLEEDLKREQQWQEEQEQVVAALSRIEEEMKTQTEQLSRKRALQQLQNKMSKVKSYKEGLSNALGEFLGEHFPIPENGGSTKKKKSFEKPAVELITLHEILEILIHKLMNTPHDPYVTINDSFWPPYIELLLRYGIALRHPEDPNRMRLEAFHM